MRDWASGTVGCWGPEAADIWGLYRNLGRLAAANLIFTLPFKEILLLGLVKPVLAFQARKTRYKEGIFMNLLKINFLKTRISRRKLTNLLFKFRCDGTHWGSFYHVILLLFIGYSIHVHACENIEDFIKYKAWLLSFESSHPELNFEQVDWEVQSFRSEQWLILFRSTLHTHPKLPSRHLRVGT